MSFDFVKLLNSPKVDARTKAFTRLYLESKAAIPKSNIPRKTHKQLWFQTNKE